MDPMLRPPASGSQQVHPARRTAIVSTEICSSCACSECIAEFLKQPGYPRVVNLTGRISAWADEFDPKVQKS